MKQLPLMKEEGMFEPEKTCKKICTIWEVYSSKLGGHTLLVHPLTSVVTSLFSLEDPHHTSIFEYDQAIRILIGPDAYHGIRTLFRKERIKCGNLVRLSPRSTNLVP